jgi:hypothetical protein
MEKRCHQKQNKKRNTNLICHLSLLYISDDKKRRNLLVHRIPNKASFIDLKGYSNRFAHTLQDVTIDQHS